MLVSFAAFVVGPATAGAEEQPAILKAYDLDWIERVRDDAWPQPKSQRPVICLLDTGVDVTPDTPADNPDGPIVARLALDGGTGLAQGTSWEHQHGTQMASIIAAPRNGFGTVGVFPQARIVSIRVTDKSQEEVYITPGAVAQGVRRCARWAEEADVRVAAVVMAESNYSQRASDVDAWSTAGNYAATHGALMLAAVGNDVGATALPPLGVDNVLPVAAGGADGARCDFGPPIAESVALLVSPGCGSSPWPPGSSGATAVAGGLVAAWVTRNSSSALSQVRAMLLGSPAAGGGVRLTGTAAALSFAGTIQPLPPGAQRVDSQTSVVASDAGATQANTRLWRPQARVRWRKGVLVVVRTNRTAGRLWISIGGRRPKTLDGGFERRVRVPVARRPRAVRIWAEGHNGAWRSLSASIRVM